MYIAVINIFIHRK